MLRSLFSAISGMRSQQTKLDVVGNNIANVNTTGFKGSRVKFQDMLSQAVRSASAPMGGRAGVNPSQVGLGMTVGGIETLHTQGSLQATGRVTDFAIQGSGYFMVSDGARTYYTRDGGFALMNGNLVNATNGLKLMGFPADANGNIDSMGDLRPITIPIGEKAITRPTTEIDLTGNLSNSATSPHITYVTVFDAQGGSHELEIEMTPPVAPAVNNWSYTVRQKGSATSMGSGTIEFDEFGNFKPPAAAMSPVTLALANTENLSINLDFSLVSQVAAETTALVKHQNGYPPGELVTFGVSNTGIVTGVYSNGLTSDLGQITLAFFSNAEGLLKLGGNLFELSSSSGIPRVGSPGEEGRGTIESGMLEMSNVDLAYEFVEMISTSRAFQANSRVVSTSDEMLQELIHLKR